MNDLKKTKDIIITCPHCKYEYLWAEIFEEDDISGRPQNIIKDPLGKILYVEYKEDYEPVLTQKYICDNCDKPFLVDAVISTESRPEEEALDFSEEYVSLL